MAYPYQTGYNQVMPPVYGGYGQQPLQPQGPMCRMVSSREEASSTPVDFSGSLMVFADIQKQPHLHQALGRCGGRCTLRGVYSSAASAARAERHTDRDRPGADDAAADAGAA